MSNILRDALKARRERVTGVRVFGNTGDEHRAALLAKLNISQISMETMQQQQVHEQQALLNLFAFKPAQTGFSSVAEMTAQAINNPNNTAILILEGDDQSSSTLEVEVQQLVEELQKTQAAVFTDENDLVEYVNRRTDGEQMPTE